jgi:transposase
MKVKISKNKIHQRLMDHKDIIIQKEKQGMPIAEIAQEYKVHLVTIYDFLRECGIKRITNGRFTSELVLNKENIIRQYREEVPVKAIAENESVTMKTIYKYLKKWGVRKEGDYKIYRGYDDEGKVKSKKLTFEQRVSPELLARMKENTRINKLYIKIYPWRENRFILETKKKILEGV